VRDGLWRVTRLDTGKVAWETTWSQGQWDGRSTSYWENGQKLKEGEHRDGLEHGVWRFWFENGTLAAEGRYEAGRKSDDWQYWDEDGKRIPYDAWEEQYAQWDWAYDDMTGFPHGSNWPEPPVGTMPLPHQ
jgi:antitoxin component YwqK of YwqJK toxin-antitoxin module